MTEKQRASKQRKAPSKSAETPEIQIMLPRLTDDGTRVEKEIKEEPVPSKKSPISQFVSNPEGNVYAISGLPEEFIATLFAWVSRSSKSFKTHLEEALKDYDVKQDVQAFKTLDEKSKKFHEKWTVGYGHSSVAEHAVAHVGIEGVSRLATAELELANQFLSITEYSQRYQKPKHGEWFNPFKALINNPGPLRNMIPNPAHAEFESFMNMSYGIFEDLIDLLYTDMKKEFVDSLEGKAMMKDTSDVGKRKVDRHLDALMKLAFEDARYVLPLSMHSQLGMTANARSWRDTIATLANSDFAESKVLAEQLKTEITKVTPVLLRHAEPSDYAIKMKKRKKVFFDEKAQVAADPSMKHSHLIGTRAEYLVIDELLSFVLMEEKSFNFGQAVQYVRSLDEKEKTRMIFSLLDDMQHFDSPPEAFKQISYKAMFHVTEANWHQLLRHNRLTDFTYAEASVYHGYRVPKGIRRNQKAMDRFMLVVDEAKSLFMKHKEEYPKEVQYYVTNAHIRPVYASFSLWEAYHLINLRTSPEAQWDIRSTFDHLYEQLKVVHPTLISKAKRRHTH